MTFKTLKKCYKLPYNFDQTIWPLSSDLKNKQATHREVQCGITAKAGQKLKF